MTQVLPIFPLPIVLFPGTIELLHIFEPRYRRMLTDCLAGDRRFGLVYCPKGTPEESLPLGTVGTVAVIERAHPLPDGRSNIAVRGSVRFAFGGYASDAAPYRRGHVTPWPDAAEPGEGVQGVGMRVRALVERAARTTRILQDDDSASTELPDDATGLSFHAAQYLELPLETRQELLASTSPRERLAALELALAEFLPTLEARAALHQRAKTNGHGAA